MITLIAAAYLLGSIPFGLLLTRACGMGDIRRVGSGNIGATNVLRSGRKELAFATLLLDMGKGAVAVYAAKNIASPCFACEEYLPPAVALSAVLGHIFPLWLRFKGGKGVATAMGALLAAYPAAGLLYMGLWAALFVLTRISSAAALGGISLVTFITAAGHFHSIAPDLPLLILLLALAIILHMTHRSNIRRLLSGTEHRFGKKTP